MHGVIVGEAGLELLLGQLYEIAIQAREPDLQRIPLWRHGPHLHGGLHRLRLGGHRLGGEVERNTEHVGVLHIEQSVFVQFVRLPTQRAADHLLAQQLRAERAHAQHVGNGVGVPPFSKHRHGHDAANGFAESVWLAHGVHDFAL